MENIEFYIDKVLIKCSYTITEKGKDPDNLDYDVFNISYTHYKGGIPNGPFPLKIFVNDRTVKIGQRPDFESTDEILKDFKVAFLESRKKHCS